MVARRTPAAAHQEGFEIRPLRIAHPPPNHCRSPQRAALNYTFELTGIGRLSDLSTRPSAQYTMAAMEQALKTKQHYDLYGLRFEVDQATIQADAQPLLDDIATALNNFPEWRLRIVGHTDATGDAEQNAVLSLERASAIKGVLVERGIDAQRLDTAGAGPMRPIASNDTDAGQALNRRVELARFTDSAEAKRLLKAMSDSLPRKPRYRSGSAPPSRLRPRTIRSSPWQFRHGDAQPAGQGSRYALRRLRPLGNPV